MTKDKDIPLDQYVGAKLYYHLGRAITQWAHVQDSLLRVFSKLIGEVDFQIASMIFYSPSSYEVRIDIVDNVAKAVLTDPDLLKEWNDLRDKIITKKRKRNILAHLMALHDFENPDKSVIRPHLFNATVINKFQNKSIPSYTAKDIQGISQLFGQLSEDLRNFSQKIPPPLK